MVTYRTDDPARWGIGKGANLTAPEIDGNFWELAQRLVAVETNPAAPNNISAITVTGSQMIVHMDDGSTHGPFTLPTAMIHYRGDWAPGVSYDELDIFAAPADGGMFFSTRAHVSAATFDRAAVDANGNPLYQWLFPMAQGGAATLGELGDVYVSAVELGQTVKWDGSVWVPGSIPSRLEDLNAVYFPAPPASGQLLGWDGWQWTPVDPPAGGGGGQHMWRMRFVNSRTGWHNVREIQFRTAAGVARAATDASSIASPRWGSPGQAIDGLTNNYTSLDSPVAGEYLGAAFPQFMDVVEFAINPYLGGFSGVDLDIEHSTDGGLTWQVAGQIRGATMSDGVWSTFPVAIPTDAGGGGSMTFLGLADTPAAFGAAGQIAAVNAAGDALEFINPPSGSGAADLTGLSDVTVAGPVAAHFLRHNGAEWVNAALAWADIPDKPATFPPSAHTHPWADVSGKPATVAALPAALGSDGQVLKMAGTSLVWAADEAGGAAVAAGAKFWRMNISAINGDLSYVAAVGIELRDADGVNLVGSGTATASAFATGNGPELAFAPWTADSGSAYWTAATPMPHWVQYEFPAAADVHSVTLTGVRLAERMPRDFTIEWSDDGTTWNVAATITGETNWQIGGVDTREYRVSRANVDGIYWQDVYGKPAAAAALPDSVGSAGQVMQAGSGGSIEWVKLNIPPAAGTFSHWRVRLTPGNNDGTMVLVEEIQFRKAAGVNEAASASPGAIFYSGFSTPAVAFDGSVGDYATSNGPHDGHYLGYRYDTAIAPEEFYLRRYFGATTYPIDYFVVEASNDGVSWQEVLAFNNDAPWSGDDLAVQVPKAVEPVSWSNVSEKPATIDALPATVGSAQTVLKAQADGTIAWAVDDIGPETRLGRVTATANYAVADADLAGNRLLRMDVSAANTVAIPAGLTGTEPMTIVQEGAGQTSLVAGTGVTIKSAGGLRSLRSQYSSARLIPDGADAYYLVGDLG